MVISGCCTWQQALFSSRLQQVALSGSAGISITEAGIKQGEADPRVSTSARRQRRKKLADYKAELTQREAVGPVDDHFSRILQLAECSYYDAKTPGALRANPV